MSDAVDSESWSRIVDQLGGWSHLEAGGRAAGAFQRPRAVKDAPTLLRLILMYGPGGNSLRGTCALAAASGIAVLSDVSLLERFRVSGRWLEGLCSERLGLLAKQTGVTNDRPIRIVDGTRIPGPGGRAYRLHLAYDLPEGRISEARLTDLSGAEKLTHAPVRPGEIRLADRCYPRPDDLAAVLDEGADVVVRLTWSSLRLLNPDKSPFDFDRVYRRAEIDGHAQAEVLVDKAKAPKSFKPFPLRLVAIRNPPEAIERSRKRVMRSSSKAQNRIDPRTLKAAEYVLLLTSLPAETHSPEKIGALYRLRWQIELAIKRLKSILHFDRLPAKDPDLARTWILANLLTALLIEEKRADLGNFFP